MAAQRAALMVAVVLAVTVAASVAATVAQPAALVVAASAVVVSLVAASAVAVTLVAALAAVTLVAVLAAAVAMPVVAADMVAVADTGKFLKILHRRPVCFGRRAFFVSSKPAPAKVRITFSPLQLSRMLPWWPTSNVKVQSRRAPVVCFASPKNVRGNG
jgi:hypothetical protein